MANQDRWAKARFTVHDSDGTTREITVQGRNRWALESLIDAGEMGCTPIDHPGPRWSAYKHKLKHKYGLDIPAPEEKHGGPFKGTHARYILKSRVTRTEAVQP
jgi:hypothetical protein